MAGTILLLFLGAACFYFLRLSKSNVTWAKLAVVVCAILLVVLAVARMSESKDISTGAVMDRYERYQAICGEVLGESLAARHPAARVVLLTAPPATAPGRQALLDSLQKALTGGGLTVSRKDVTPPEGMMASLLPVDDPGLTPEMAERFKSEMTMDTSLWFNTTLLGEILDDLKGQADLVVCVLSFPMGADAAKLPPKGSGPALVLLNADIQEPQELLQSTVLDSVVLYQGGPDMWKPGTHIPKDKNAAFARHYKLLTAEGI